MSRETEHITAEAAAWHAASGNDDMDWIALTRWLEADPRHAAAYDEIMLTSAALDAHRDVFAPAAPVAANDDTPTPSQRRWMAWGTGTIAAGLAVALALPGFLEPDPIAYATQGAAQEIALQDGSRIELAPHSRLEVGGRQQDHLALTGGAWFDIRHDPERAMTVEVNGLKVSDIGTVFDIQTGGDSVRVAVADGKLSVTGETLPQAVELTAGRALHVDPLSRTAHVRTVSGDQVGSWRDGSLTYDGAPLSMVAADLTRYAGVRVEVADGLASRQFSGTLVIGDGQAALRDLSRLMDLRLGRSAAGYRLDAAR